MKLMTRDTDYAVRALLAIAGGGREVVSVAELTRSLKTPYPFLRKILQALRRRNVLRAYKGKGGGFQLVLPPEKIFLLDLMKIFQGPLKLNECMFKKKVCPERKTCFLNKRISMIEKNVIAQLEGITISFLLKQADPAGRPKLEGEA